MAIPYAIWVGLNGRDPVLDDTQNAVLKKFFRDVGNRKPLIIAAPCTPAKQLAMKFAAAFKTKWTSDFALMGEIPPFKDLSWHTSLLLDIVRFPNIKQYHYFIFISHPG